MSLIPKGLLRLRFSRLATLLALGIQDELYAVSVGPGG